MVLQELAVLDPEITTKSAIVRAVEWVAKHLGNTAAVCRKCYIHPAIFEGYLDGTLLRTLANKTQAYLRRNIAGMSAEEAPVVAFLRLRLTKLAVEEANAGSTRRRSRAKTRAALMARTSFKKVHCRSASDHEKPADYRRPFPRTLEEAAKSLELRRRLRPA